LKEKLKIKNINGITIYPPFMSSDEISHTKNINKTKILGFYGRILPCKGVFLLVKYWEILSKKYPDWKLVITGNYTSFSKKYNDDIIQYINNNKLNSIIEINNKDINGSSEKNEVFNNMNIFVQLSLYEGLPFTVLEALENKTPVIHTNVGGIEELKNSNIEILNFKGLTFNNFDFIDYEKVISDNLYNKYFNENYIIFEKAFDKMVLKNNNFDNFDKVIEKFNYSNFEKKIKNIL